MNFLSRSLAISVIVFFFPATVEKTFGGFERFCSHKRIARGVNDQIIVLDVHSIYFLQPQKSFNAWKIQQDLRWFFTEQDDVSMNKLRTVPAVAVHKKDYYRNFFHILLIML